MLTRGDVQYLLAGMHLIDTAKMPAFAARMRHLQRLGFPPGINTGKGKAAEYGPTELLLLALAFELLQLGVTPERATKVLLDNKELVIREGRAVVRELRRRKKGQQPVRLLLIDPRTLSSLQHSAASGHDELRIADGEHLAAMFRHKQSAPPRIAVIDVLGVIARLGAVMRFGWEDGETAPETLRSEVSRFWFSWANGDDK